VATRRERTTTDPRADGAPPEARLTIDDPSPARMSPVAAVIRTARPKQWIKNVLVFAAPGAAGVLTHRGPFLRSLVAFGAFCLAASGTYFLNDVLDREGDRAHPRKRHRPIAAGALSPTAAVVIAAVLLAAGVATGAAVTAKLALVLAIYVAVTFSYSTWLKHEPVIDLAMVAAGFVLRAIAGGVAARVPLSDWFLIVASFGSLFMVAGKRHAEHVDLGDERGTHRQTLSTYSLAYLRYVRSISSAVAIAAYCLWAFEKAKVSSAPLWFQLSIVPFVLAILRYALLLDQGRGGAPEDLVLSDRTLQVLGGLWVLSFAVGVHVH
jgi:decaprenyl-phosphate phosphoribosyltransferase